MRSNLWLTIHVLTEVSSYAAFGLAWMLGLIATLYYLTATYRRSPRFSRTGLALGPRLPLLVVGGIGVGCVLWTARPAVGDRRAVALRLGSQLGRMGTRCSTCLLGHGARGRVISLADRLLASGAKCLNRLTFRDHADPRRHGGDRAQKHRNPSSSTRGAGRCSRRSAIVKPLSNFIYRTMQVGVLLIAAGTILGGVWADYSWGRFWGWDPKEVWALITLLVYLIPLHGRFAGWVSTFGLVVASVVCFLSVIMAWYGVNFVLGVGLHSYGFVEGGSQGIMMVIICRGDVAPVGRRLAPVSGQRV